MDELIAKIKEEIEWAKENLKEIDYDPSWDRGYIAACRNILKLVEKMKENT